MTTIAELPRRRAAAARSDQVAVSDGRADLVEHVLLTTQEAAALTTYTPHGLENLR